MIQGTDISTALSKVPVTPRTEYIVVRQEIDSLPHQCCLHTHITHFLSLSLSPSLPPSIHPCRHLNLAQTVSLCVVTAGDAMERARLLHRFIEIASLLQSGNYGNLFSFIAVMQGLAVPQVRPDP